MPTSIFILITNIITNNANSSLKLSYQWSCYTLKLTCLWNICLRTKLRPGFSSVGLPLSLVSLSLFVSTTSHSPSLYSMFCVHMVAYMYVCSHGSSYTDYRQTGLDREFQLSMVVFYKVGSALLCTANMVHAHWLLCQSYSISFYYRNNCRASLTMNEWCEWFIF